ncbi:hypothetical protein FG476_12010 [Xylella fastidiosa subsp. multiplex]|uniref:Bro-N domain-containing protein n=2 Tax=Xylella fastidiosa TaxID=2371 RepID=A0A9Q4QU29_XYLFS|nr:hypothetical protein [Xylella fastidiosa subsp. multiplex]MBE0274404.1 hypothetical protein [Xylella fastidiosa subsp. multiplex]MBE0276793.1 hypothetical protein [Xylella fastidiosa subsp. multiplex]MBE0281201.1 hypothetical protein [Xylella fastidiosa subsp. multiplex]MRT54314.1 hypothetical protein [Xylella fastidiosa subsp. multiplex]
MNGASKAPRIPSGAFLLPPTIYGGAVRKTARSAGSCASSVPGLPILPVPSPWGLATSGDGFSSRTETCTMHNTLPASVDFSDVSLTIIDHDGIPYLTAADLARALGYADERAVSRIYNRHSEEFTVEMSLVVNLTTKGFGSGNSEKPTRLFSPRGCHLVAMFARTSVAAAFRRWVLDVLEVLPSIRKTGSYSTTGTMVNDDALCAIWFLCDHFKKLHEMSRVNKVPQALYWLGATEISGELGTRLLEGMRGGVLKIEKALGPHLEQAAQKGMGNASRHLS